MVSWSSWPLAFRPLDCWNSFTAFCVSGPTLPSAVTFSLVCACLMSSGFWPWLDCAWLWPCRTLRLAARGHALRRFARARGRGCFGLLAAHRRRAAAARWTAPDAPPLADMPPLARCAATGRFCSWLIGGCALCDSFSLSCATAAERQHCRCYRNCDGSESSWFPFLDCWEDYPDRSKRRARSFSSQRCTCRRPPRPLPAAARRALQRLVIELAARRNRSGKLELRERGLRLRAEITVDRAGVETELTQLLLHLADEAGIRISRGLRRGIGLVRFRVQRGERPRSDGAQGREKADQEEASHEHSAANAVPAQRESRESVDRIPYSVGLSLARPSATRP